MAARNNTTLEEIRVTEKFREYIGEKKTLKPGSIQVESYNINYWCPLNFKRHDKTLRNASKHVVADSFFKTKPPP